MRTAVLAILAVLCCSGCAAWQAYNSTVAARQVGVSANSNADTGDVKGGINYRVEYRQ